MNMANILKQAQQMQSQVTKVEKELNEKSYFGTAGGDAVKVEVNGANRVLSVNIDESLLEKDSKEMIQDMVMIATNQALESAKKEKDEKLGAITGGVKLPGIM